MFTILSVFIFFTPIFLQASLGNLKNCGHRHFPSVNNDSSANNNNTKLALTPLISGGSQVLDIGKWPWLAAFKVVQQKAEEEGGHLNHTKTTFACSASIISANYLLTAAHCLFHNNQRNVMVIGSTNSRVDDGTKYHRVKRFVKYPKYQSENINPDYDPYDIAILELEEPLKFNENVQPICLAAKNFTGSGEKEEGVNVSIAGWGLTCEENDVVGKPTNWSCGFGELHEGMQRMVPLHECREAELTQLHPAESSMGLPKKWKKGEEIGKMANLLAQMENGTREEQKTLLEANTEWHDLEMLKRRLRLMYGIAMKTSSSASLSLQLEALEGHNFTEFIRLRIDLLQNSTFKQLDAVKVQETIILGQQLYARPEFIDRMLCTSDIQHGSTYSGDSGGPLMIEQEDATTSMDGASGGGDGGKWFQIGVVHDVYRRYSSESPHQPGNFVAVAPYCGWIRDVTEGEVECMEF